MHIGATMVQGDDFVYWKRRLTHNMWMRVFPQGNGIPPGVYGLDSDGNRIMDARYQYALDVEMKIIFVSSKVCCLYKNEAGETDDEGGFAKVMDVLEQLANLKDDKGRGFDEVWYTEHHEPERDFKKPPQPDQPPETERRDCKPQPDGLYGTEAYKRAITMAITHVENLRKSSDVYRDKIKVGPVLTRYWTEEYRDRHPEDTEDTPCPLYGHYDPGIGDFFGVDMYGKSETDNPPRVVTNLTPTADFLREFKNYKYESSDPHAGPDNRIRCFPELGYIGIPADHDGAMRARWLHEVYDEVSTWNEAETGWKFQGFIWWNAKGTPSDNPVQGIGIHRWFELNRRHNGLRYCPTCPVPNPPNCRHGNVDREGGYDTFEVPASKAQETFNHLVECNFHCAGNDHCRTQGGLP
ncbi:hypothetical protein [Actinoplanes sp. NPDC049118]|uniref:hypothetical protein n=1 Tax=Actinoplanes sp. NPDC049118 TaxID=3155769 RepID=UPI0033DC1828